MSAAKDGSMTASQTDYSTWDTARLICRITELEQQLNAPARNHHRGQNKPINDLPPTSPLINPPDSYPPGPCTPSRSSSRAARPPRDIDPSKYNTRFIALKLAYLGQQYNGYEHTNGNITPFPTIEEELWKALRKARLIFPKTVECADGSEGANRLLRPYSIDWNGCDYSKCGRTDRGVSAFGQVVGIRVRSARPKKKSGKPVETQPGTLVPPTPEAASMVTESSLAGLDINVSNLEIQERHWDDIADELPYIQMLNGVLPEDIRILAWCPHPPPDFDARFSCRERRYRYFFTQPAFCPTPGPLGFVKRPCGALGSKMREGWLDINAMREGAKHFVGSHDFRNFCKVDASKQITNFVRKISHADIQLLGARNLPPAFPGQQGFQQDENPELQRTIGSDDSHDAAMEVYYFTVHGSAFLWHQVRHMMAILFLIGQGLESPSIIPELLDVSKNPRRPTYEIASDAPLVLWDCIFPSLTADNESEGGLDWVYAGDPRTAKSGRGDGKFGHGGTVDDLWSLWRQRKIDEVLAASLLELVVSQGDSSSVARGGFKHPTSDKLNRSQKMFYGSNEGKPSGKYIPLMQRRRNDTVEDINLRWFTKGKRRVRNSATKTGVRKLDDAT
ncbi:pseudouridine synthase deg1 [Emydomyces testavorans]|uniref:Pseudouridine synthase deg1 n=1 Tax=Emydomyces testavorans TaxID=2070801 RepID=A0AAF0IFL1_9EURO|nr:pseudouridine synthase deg1 [Emydomyces testavorans]